MLRFMIMYSKYEYNFIQFVDPDECFTYRHADTENGSIKESYRISHVSLSHKRG